MTSNDWGKPFTPETVPPLDLHKVKAAEMFGVPIDQVTDEQRRAAKAQNFGAWYGKTEVAKLDDLAIAPEGAKPAASFFNPTKDSPATAAQMAAVFAAKGTSEQQHELVDYLHGDPITDAINQAGMTVAFDIPAGAPMDKPDDWDTKPLGPWDGGVKPAPVVVDHASLWAQTQNAAQMEYDMRAGLIARGYVETSPGEWQAPTPVNSVGSYYAPDGTLMNADGTRSIFDDIDAGPWVDEDGNEWATATAQGLPEPAKPALHNNPTCYAWHPESGCGVIFSDRDALNEALEAEPLLVEMTKEEYDQATKINAADWGSTPAMVYVDETRTDPANPFLRPYQQAVVDAVKDGWLPAFEVPPEPVKTQTELSRALDTIMSPGFGETQIAARVAPIEHYDEAEGPYYVVYFGDVLYTVLSGPYDKQDEAKAAFDWVWPRFKDDKTFDMSFPTRDPANLRATTVQTRHNLKGAYGKK